MDIEINKMSGFPRTLYVNQSLSASDPFDGYANCDGVEDGDIVAVYQLVKVTKVETRTTKHLILENGIVYENITPPDPPDTLQSHE